MFAAYVIVTVAANAFSGIAAILHFKPILLGMARTGVAESWLTYPIGTLKTAAAASSYAIPGRPGSPGPGPPGTQSARPPFSWFGLSIRP
jgi:hypothetical protein